MRSTAPFDGKVSAMSAKVGDQVVEGAVLAVLETDTAAA